jgi:hypothetical protein
MKYIMFFAISLLNHKFLSQLLFKFIIRSKSSSRKVGISRLIDKEAIMITGISALSNPSDELNAERLQALDFPQSRAQSEFGD